MEFGHRLYQPSMPTPPGKSPAAPPEFHVTKTTSAAEEAYTVLPPCPEIYRQDLSWYSSRELPSDCPGQCGFYITRLLRTCRNRLCLPAIDTNPAGAEPLSLVACSGCYPADASSIPPLLFTFIYYCREKQFSAKANHNTAHTATLFVNTIVATTIGTSQL